MFLSGLLIAFLSICLFAYALWNLDKPKIFFPMMLLLLISAITAALGASMMTTSTRQDFQKNCAEKNGQIAETIKGVLICVKNTSKEGKNNEQRTK